MDFTDVTRLSFREFLVWAFHRAMDDPQKFAGRLMDYRNCPLARYLNWRFIGYVWQVQVTGGHVLATAIPIIQQPIRRIELMLPSWCELLVHEVDYFQTDNPERRRWISAMTLLELALNVRDRFLLKGVDLENET